MFKNVEGISRTLLSGKIMVWSIITKNYGYIYHLLKDVYYSFLSNFRKKYKDRENFYERDVYLYQKMGTKFNFP